MARENNIYSELTDAAIVEGVYMHDRQKGTLLYEVCHTYFKNHFRTVAKVNEYDKDDIFQNSLETLLRKIENRIIYTENGVLKGRNGAPFTGKLTTYFMSIAYLKYKEFFREPPMGAWEDLEINKIHHFMSDADLYKDILYDDEENVTLSIIADCISKMSERCNQILTLFYCEKKNYDEILEIMPTYKSKDALKTKKNKCLKTLRGSVKTIYNSFFI